MNSSAAPLTPASEFLWLERTAGSPESDLSGQVVLLPGAAVPLLPVTLPRRLRGAAREQVAWRQVKDQTGLTPAAVELRPYSETGGEDWQRVLLLDATQMQGWRQQAGADVRALLPDYLALPAARELWVMDRGETQIRMRLGLQDGFTAEPDLAQLMLTQMLAEAKAAETLPKALLLQGTPPAWLEALLEAAKIPLVQELAALTPLGLETPKILSHGELAADLRRDPRAARQQLRRRLLPWRWPLLAGALALALWATLQITQTERLRQDTGILRGEIDTLVRDRFVPTGPLLDVRLQVARALARQQAAEVDTEAQMSPLQLLGQVADVLIAVPVQPDLVSYDSAAGMTLDLRLADFAAVDQLVAVLQSTGLAVELRDARVAPDNQGVQLELQLRPEGKQ